MILFSVILLVASLPCFLCQNRDPAFVDPLCIGKVCPSGTTCRLIKQNGVLQSFCGPVVQYGNGCMFGAPILDNSTGTMEDLTCYSKAPCPDGAYCSTAIADYHSFCCRSDPNQTVREGLCPAPEPNPSPYSCYDECKSDGDCFNGEKCCTNGCSLKCRYPLPAPTTTTTTVPPPPVQDPCDSTFCPINYYCRRIGAPCRNPYDCRPEGQCNPCEPINPMARRLGYRILMDPDGCLTVAPARRPAPRPSVQNPPPVYNTRPNYNDPLSLLFFWLFGN